MIKKFLNWARKLSLSQQLFTIIVSFVAFFVCFFVFFINTNIDLYTREQMYNRLNDTQNDLIYFYQGHNLDIKSIVNREDSDVLTYFFKEESDGSFEVISSNEKFNEKNPSYKIIYDNVLLLDSIGIGKHYAKSKGFEHQLSDNGNYGYYVIRAIDDKTYMVSLLNNDYTNAFKENLLNNVVDITIFVVCGFFLILMLWVATIIHPLNQIKNYIEKIKVGKKAKLKIHREDEIGEVANALMSMRDELERQEKTKEEMIHNISHDLKTPIATIKSYSESIKDGIYPYDTLEASVDVIINNAQRLEKKVQSLLMLNRVEYILSQKKEIRFTDMKDIVETVVLNTKVIRPDLEIETNLQTSLFNGNEEAWRVCVENIIENAFRYAKEKIIINLDDYQLCIYNDGESIPQDRLQTLFKPYEKGAKGQFGLGLSIVYKVVNGNGYRIVVENVERGGVIFMIKK